MNSSNTSQFHVYDGDPLAHSLELIDAIGRRASQLNALLAVIIGGGQARFDDCNSEIRGRYLWLASDLSEEIERLVDQLQPENLTVRKGDRCG